jgi:hypothetical protein
MMFFVHVLAMLASAIIVSGGQEIDYQPSPLQDPDGRLLVAFERLTPPSQGFIGDIWITFSSDTGYSWTDPLPAVTSSYNLRHPALVHVPAGGYRLFYLSDQIGTYRIYSAFSSDGISWTEEGEVELGWPSTADIGNPTVSAEGDSALVMSYDRFFGLGGYAARSVDGGGTWDTEMQRINRKGRLNRLIRHSDGTYLCSWQETGGGTIVNIFASHSPDLINWAESDSLTTNDNGHDSMPFEDFFGESWVYYAKYSGSVYEIMRRNIPEWGIYSEEELVYSGTHNATQPHPLLLGDGRTALFWGEWWDGYNESDVMMEILDTSGLISCTECSNGQPPRLWPNPFKGELNIQVTMPASGPLAVMIFDITGRLVGEVRDGEAEQGLLSLAWRPVSDLPAGIYTVRITSFGLQQIRSCVLLR